MDDFHRIELEAIASRLGAKVRPSLDNVCTHYVYVGKANEPPKEVKFLMNQYPSPAVVCPKWITQCESQGVRVAEALFPYCLDEKSAIPAIVMPGFVLKCLAKIGLNVSVLTICSRRRSAKFSSRATFDCC